MNLDSFQPVFHDIRVHACMAYPHESCGVVLRDATGLRYRECRNRAPGASSHFILEEADFAAAEDAGEVLAIVHSHPDAAALPSMADRVMCERSRLPWLIVGWPSGTICLTRPAGFVAPLLGREFAHGVLDCYSLLRDYYAAACGLGLPDFERRDRWWEVPGTELYLRHFADAGFVRVDDGPRLHDGILIQVLSDQVNHAAVFIGDGAAFDALLAARGEAAAPSAGSSLMLHHLYGRLSCRDVYGGYWQRHTRLVVRHRSLLDAA